MVDLSDLPNWITALATSVAAIIALTTLIFLRSEKNPIAFLTVEGAGPEGATLCVYVKNRSSHTMRVDKLSVLSPKGAKIIDNRVVPLEKPVSGYGPEVFLDELPLSFEVLPSQEAGRKFKVAVKSSSREIDVRMSVSISEMRRTAKRRKIPVSAIIPAHADKSQA
jgi:hypothetical protein